MPLGFRKQLSNRQNKTQWLKGLQDFHGIHCSSGFKYQRISGHPLWQIQAVFSLCPENRKFALTTPPLYTPEDLLEEWEPLGRHL